MGITGFANTDHGCPAVRLGTSELPLRTPNISPEPLSRVDGRADN